MKKLFLLIPFLCLLASPVWAFPDNGVLETFTGTDTTTPPNANWTNANILGCTGLDIEDNAVTGTTSSQNCGGYWDTTSFNADQEGFATIVNISSGVRGDILLRLANIGVGTTDGYAVSWQDAAATVTIYRIDNGTATALGAAISQTITTTDKLGGRAVGDQICAWFSDDGGAWVELACRTDATYSAGGFIGLNLNGNTGVGMMDDFGGGNVATAVTIRPPSQRWRVE
jgi:hypothetical protein